MRTSPWYRKQNRSGTEKIACKKKGGRKPPKVILQSESTIRKFATVSPATSPPPSRNRPPSNTQSQFCLSPGDPESAPAPPTFSPGPTAPTAHSDPPTAPRGSSSAPPSP